MLFAFPYLESDAYDGEIGQLVNAITTNLTAFFREAHHFEHLRDQLLLPLMRHPPAGGAKRIRIWSAGCSSGAEPYSIAMVAAACLEQYGGWDIKILATDIDTTMLERGQNGHYRPEDMEPVPPTYHRYLEHGKDGIVMSDRLKQMVHFKRLNLLSDWPMKGTFDIIFCRNVVIYFDKPTQKALFSRLATLHKPHGYLFGHSENLFDVSADYRLLGQTIYQREA